MRLKKIIPRFIIMLIACHGLACNDNFQPLSNNDKYAYSMNGVLDLHADTQWVRLMPIGESLISTSQSSNITVNITREETGETSQFNDSLFVFGGNARVWNYWTTMPLHPNEEFILTTEVEGKINQTTITIPSVLQPPVVDHYEARKGLVSGSSEDPIVMADTKYYIRKLTRVDVSPAIIEVQFSHLENITRGSDGEYNFKFDDTGKIEDQVAAPFGFIIVKKEVIVATGSKDWPDYTGLSEQEMALPGLTSNIENGTGFVGGIAKRSVPMETCYDARGNEVDCGTYVW